MTSPSEFFTSEDQSRVTGESEQELERHWSEDERRLAETVREQGESSISRFKILRTQLAHRKIVVVAFGVILLFILFALFGPLLTMDPNAQDYTAILVPPGQAHLLGTDDLGRDVLARAATGARVSLIAGIGSTALAMALGVPLGLLTGYHRGWLDSVLMRTTDLILAFPFLIFAVGLAAVFGASLMNVIVALGLIFTPSVIRVTRGEVISLRELDYVSGAVADGAGGTRIMFRYILPNALNPLIVQATLFIPGAIVSEAALSFLGLGVPPPTASWGAMLTDAQPYLSTAVWLALVPGLMIAVTTLAFNLFGDGVRDVLDPRST